MTRSAGSNFLILFFVVMVAIISCNEKKSIEKDYLESEAYRSFKERTDQEIEQKAKLAASFKVSLRQFVGCKADKFETPFKLELAQLEKIPEECILNREAESLKLLGESNNSNQLIRWILLERTTVYNDQELVAAVFQDQELQSFKTVGVFQKNPSRLISSVLKVEKEAEKIRITSQTTREIVYPIEQTNTVTATYQIDATGDIQQL